MPTLRAVKLAMRIATAVASTGFGIFLLVRAWAIPLDGSSAMFTPLAFVGAMVCFGMTIALLMPLQPRRGRPAAR